MSKLRLCALLLALPALFLSACTMWKEKAVSTWSSATGAEQLERLFWQDVKSKKLDEIEKHLAPSFVGMGPQGVLDRAATLQHLQAMNLEDYTLGEFNSQSDGADLVVTYTITVRGTVNGRPLPSGAVRMMSVWQQVKKGWVLIAHSTVPQQG